MNPAALSRPRQIAGLAGWLLLCFGTSAVGALATVSAGTFYESLVRPPWAPPAWLFGPVWTSLFLCMAIAAWLVWRSPGPPASRTLALWLFVAQLALNAIWSWLFFAWRLGAIALLEVLVLWLLIAATAATFRRVSRPAALLMVPYLLWVAFAATLNAALWRANPQWLG